MTDKLISYTDKLVESGQTDGHGALLSATAKLMSAADNESAARALGIQRAFDSGERLADCLHTLGTHQPTGSWLQNASNNRQFSRLDYGQTDVQHSATGIGADALFGERWLLGFSATQTRSNAYLDSVGGHLTGIGQQMAVYARASGKSQPFHHFSSLLSVDQHTIDTQRQILAGDTLNHVSGQAYR